MPRSTDNAADAMPDGYVLVVEDETPVRRALVKSSSTTSSDEAACAANGKTIVSKASARAPRAKTEPEFFMG